MKKIIYSLGIGLLTLASTVSCNQVKNLLSKEVTISAKEMNIVIAKGVKSKADVNSVLYEGDFDFDIKAELERNGVSFDQLLSLALKSSKLELVSPESYDLSFMQGMQLFFGKENNLVAEVSKVEGKVITFKIVNAQLLEQLKDNKLHVILKGKDLPRENLTMKLVMDYLVKVSLLE